MTSFPENANLQANLYGSLMCPCVYRKFEVDTSETVTPTTDEREAEQVDFTTVLKKVWYILSFDVYTRLSKSSKTNAIRTKILISIPKWKVTEPTHTSVQFSFLKVGLWYMNYCAIK